MRVDTAVQRTAALLSAIEAINAPKLSCSVGSAADAGPKPDKGPVESVSWVESCVLERCDVACKHGESRLSE